MSEQVTTTAIRAAVDEYTVRSDISNLSSEDWFEARDKLIANAPDWLRYLLAENARLQAVVEAGRAFDFSEFVWYDREDGRYCQFCNAEYKASDHSDFVHDSNCPIDKLQAAVRTLDGGVGGDD